MEIGDAIDASQRLMSDPEFAFKCRIVILSRVNSEEYLISAARAGVNEVITKAGRYEQVIRSIREAFEEAIRSTSGRCSQMLLAKAAPDAFDVSMVMSDGQWALPMLKGIVTPERINVDFINEILTQLGEEGINVEEAIDPSLMSNVLRVALNNIVKDLDVPGEQNEGSQIATNLPSAKKSATLGSKSSSSNVGGGTMEHILQNQADGIASDIENVMDRILDEKPDLVAIIPDHDQVVIDPAVLEFTTISHRNCTRIDVGFRKTGEC